MKYKIKQIKDVENCEYALKHYDWVKDKIDLKDFDMFNVRRPNNFKGRSMSVSDIVEVDGKNYYCDGVGWVELK